MAKKKQRGSYDRTGVWVSAAEKREDTENASRYPTSSYGGRKPRSGWF